MHTRIRTRMRSNIPKCQILGEAGHSTAVLLAAMRTPDTDSVHPEGRDEGSSVAVIDCA